MLNFIANHIEIIISIFALLISYLTYKENKTIYQYQFASDIRISEHVVLVDKNDLNNLDAYSTCMITYLHFINLSNFDLGFFELKAYDNKKRRIELLTTNAISFIKQMMQPLELIPINDNESKRRHLKIPEFKYGIFKAKSMTYFDIVVFPHEDSDTITIEFELPKKRILNFSPNNIHQKFVKCGMIYNINRGEK